jgi:tripartite-type tricarboxylate transporter receptor subunit TctC
MKTKRSLKVASFVAAALCFAFLRVEPARAADVYPSRTVKIIVPFPPGGGNDLTARLLAQRLQTELGQPFIVENHPGADGIVAFETVKRSAPDGYTLLLGQSTGMTVNPAVYKNLPYEPLKDFEPISTVGLFPLVLVVNAESDIKTVADLVAKAKNETTPMNLGYPTISYRLGLSLIGREAGFKFNPIAYAGSTPTLNGLLTREIDAAFVDLAAVKSQIEAGKLRALAVASVSGKEFLPNVPTLTEAGVKDVEIEFWSGLFAPAGTPPDIIAKLQAQIAQFLTTDDLKQKAVLIAMKPFANKPAQLREMIRSQIDMFTGIAKIENISIE